MHAQPPVRDVVESGVLSLKFQKKLAHRNAANRLYPPSLSAQLWKYQRVNVFRSYFLSIRS